MRILRLTLLLCLLSFLFFSSPCCAWDAATHRLSTRLAIDALPPSPLKTALSTNERLVEQHSVEPDSILKDRYGHKEEIRHYINLELYSRDPATALASLDSDLAAMRSRVGTMRLRASGTLPWTIEDTATRFAAALHGGDYAEVLRQAGYLSHYVGDASQPLHSTMHFDGYRRDRGIHARIESAVDDRASSIQKAAASEVKIQPISAVWPVTLDEIRAANSLISQLIEADRQARRVAREGPQYTAALFAAAGPLLTQQIARAASILVSIWQFECTSSGSPDTCSNR
jgi:hypothetical protein